MPEVKIQSYDFGRIVVNGKEYDRDLILTHDSVKPNWWRKRGHKLCLDDLKGKIPDDIEVLIIGTGYLGYMEVLPEVREFYIRRGVEVIEEKTVDAWKTFNRIVGSKKVAAAFHLTC